MLRFSGAGATEVGLVRGHNEDSAFVGPYLALVADGVGGAAAGEVASASAAYVVSAYALARPDGPLEQTLAEAAAEALATLRRGVAAVGERAGMATTLTAVACDGHRVVLGHVGDSRAYVYRDARMAQVSVDHTYVQQLVQAGRLSPEEAAVHQWRNVIVRCLDSSAVDDESAALDLVELHLVVGDRVLLCTDGLSDLVPTDGIEAALRLDDAQSAAGVLTQAALAAGGTDNVTCVVVDVVEGPRVVGDGRLLGAVADPSNLVDPVSVRASRRPE